MALASALVPIEPEPGLDHDIPSGVDTMLVPQQKVALKRMCGDYPLVLIEAPFGTGKPKLLKKALEVKARMGRRVLYVCANKAMLLTFFRDLLASRQRMVDAQVGPDVDVSSLCRLESTQIRLSTFDSAYRLKQQVDELVVDEGSQATALQVAILCDQFPQARRLTIVGDTHQLPPYNGSSRIPSTLIAKGPLDVFVAIGEPSIWLDQQFRLPEGMAYATGKRVYGIDRKRGGAVVDKHPVHLRLITQDTACREGGSWICDPEIAWVEETARFYRDKMGRKVTMVGFYRAQKFRMLKKLESLGLEILTADEAEGVTHEVVLVCATRFDISPHLVDTTRLLVAVTRYRYGLAISAPLQWFASIPAARGVLDYMKRLDTCPH